MPVEKDGNLVGISVLVKSPVLDIDFLTSHIV